MPTPTLGFTDLLPSMESVRTGDKVAKKIYVVVREGWWWPDRSSADHLAKLTKLLIACSSYESAALATETLLDEPEWFVGEAIINGEKTQCISATYVTEVELTD